jgi:hypothetical protein
MAARLLIQSISCPALREGRGKRAKGLRPHATFAWFHRVKCRARRLCKALRSIYGTRGTRFSVSRTATFFAASVDQAVGPVFGMAPRSIPTCCFAFSFVARGYPVEIFTYERGHGFPSWIVARDAGDILPHEPVMVHRRGPEAGSPAPRANLFRLLLLEQHGGWWVDTDDARRSGMKCHTGMPLQVTVHQSSGGPWAQPSSGRLRRLRLDRSRG